jgi:hypothetical protein
MKFGATFSTKQAEHLNLDAEDALVKILHQLDLDVIRLCGYWDLIEPQQGIYRYKWLDRLINICEQSCTKVVLAIGRKVPRWPEFHEPDWFHQLGPENQNQVHKKIIRNLINKYQHKEIVEAFQIENEPFFNFGDKKSDYDQDQIKRMIRKFTEKTEKAIITTSPIHKFSLITERFATKKIGLNYYATTYNQPMSRYLSFSWPYWFYLFRNKLLGWIDSDLELFIAELQAEPWGPDSSVIYDETEWKKSITPEKIKENFNKMERAGYKEIWFWGVEWWLYQQKYHQNSDFLRIGKSIISL